jgi:spermidine/putrescine transport system substrate-binding protein
MRHPRERFWGNSMDRRDFLRRSAAGAAALSGAGLLAACGSPSSSAPTGIKLASPENPETLPLFDDNAPIDSGLEPEKGPLKVYNWDEYIWLKVLKDFAKEYKVDYELSTFYNTAEAMNKIRTGQVDFDVFFPTPDLIPKLVAAKLLQPVNRSYLTNLKRNIWPELVDPWYDKGSRYSVPYTVYTTGIGWRTDLVDEDIGARDDPYEVFWDPKYAGKVGIYDDYREVMSMVLVKHGLDVNTTKSKDINLVRKELIDMADAVNVRTTIDGAYLGIPESKFAVHQAWSGDLAGAPYYMPAKEYGDPDGVLRYWSPPDGVIGNDTIVIPKGSKNPVLAHHFLNYMLDNKHALKNFSWLLYQPPLNAISPTKLVSDGYVLPNLRPTIVQKRDFDRGAIYTALPPEVDAEYQDAWADFKSGVGK